MECKQLDCGRFLKKVSSDPFFKREVVAFNHPELPLPMVFPETILGGRYQLDSILAVGGFGILLKARDKKVFNRFVLVKTPLFPAHLFSERNNIALEREVDLSLKRATFERKMLMHGQLRNVSNIPIIIDWGTDIAPLLRGPHRDSSGQEFFNANPAVFENLPYLVLNYFEGNEVGRHLALKKYLQKPLSSIFHMAKSIASTLERFHKLEPFGNRKYQFVYQDLKPANILGTHEGIFILIDFGSFAFLEPGQKPYNIGIHTEGFCAPEFRTDITPQLDVYSLGAVIQSIWKTMQKAAQRDQELAGKFSALPEPWLDFVKKCMETDRSDRYKDMGEVLGALNGLPKEKQDVF